MKLIPFYIYRQDKAVHIDLLHDSKYKIYVRFIDYRYHTRSENIYTSLQDLDTPTKRIQKDIKNAFSLANYLTSIEDNSYYSKDEMKVLSHFKKSPNNKFQRNTLQAELKFSSTHRFETI